jgi:Xaa-Pro aminopeptidase
MRSRLSRDERDRRWAALNAAMADAGFEALVFVGNDYRGHKGSLRYVADYNLYHRFGYALMRRGQEPVLLLPTIMADVAPSLWVSAQHNVPEPVRALAALLEPCPDGARVGIVGWRDIMRAGDFHLLRTACSQCRFEDASALFESVRVRKSSAELDGLREAAAIADSCFAALLDGLRPGETERALGARMLACCAEAGGEDPLFLCMKAVAADGAIRPRLGPPRDDVIADGGCLTFSFEMIGPSGYWTELCRMVAIGRPAPGLQAMAARGCAAMTAGQDVMRPGRPMSGIQAATAAALADTDFDLSGWSGHSIGQDVIETPLIGTDDTAIVADMAIAFHPLFTDPTRCALFYMADIFLVGAGGAERCSRWPLELYTRRA